MNRAVRKMQLKALVKYIGKSYLGFKLRPAQIRAGARTLLDMRTNKMGNKALFWWEANARNTPKP